MRAPKEQYKRASKGRAEDYGQSGPSGEQRRLSFYVVVKQRPSVLLLSLVVHCVGSLCSLYVPREVN